MDTGDDEGRIDVDKKFWLGQRPESIIRVADSLVKIFQTADRHLRVTYLQQFWGFALGEKPKNFATIAPKQKFVNVRARIRDTETWSKRLTRAGFEVTGGTPGRSVRFRVKDAPRARGANLLRQFADEAYSERAASI